MVTYDWFASTMPAAGLKAFLRHDAVNGGKMASRPEQDMPELAGVSTLAMDETVTITSENGADAANLVWTENQIGYLTRVEATGDAGSGIAYSIVGGADAARFEIDAVSGVLRFAWNADPDYEAPADADGDNRYEVVVAASNGVDSDEQALTVRVYNANEAPSFTSFGGAASASVTISENSLVVATIAAVDPEALVNTPYAIAGGADAALFMINPWNGLLSFRAVPDYEAPADAGGNNVYDVVVRATDGTNIVTQTLAVTVSNAAAESSFTGTPSSNTITGTTNADTIAGREGGDTLFGLDGADLLDGGAGSDTLVGGAGVDQFLGGAGSDVFRFDALADSSVGSPDMIFDFSRGQGDRISVTNIDADLLLAGNQNFTFLGANAFTGTAGQLRYEKVGGHTFIFADADGDGVADFQLQVNGEFNFYGSDFLL
ncbi:M10 family metallopeptidase C-terminal domain-containing protein [Sphingomonas sp. UNC305MFCol5.2]|uniref:M10 family metallopeptidase C-terminal domain-containing protein n=1 Tax=Sphingomonas sp. UNC305MFCol5.2 TaxID=1449076 RepID=UPI00041A57F7|nr:M10 family metallopeptidase C-terminal domain-containing protein [Sphingomonas sp. UNC305MFCol5.2]